MWTAWVVLLVDPWDGSGRRPGAVGVASVVMTGSHRSGGYLGGLLASRRLSHFVGRIDELEEFEAGLRSTEAPFAVLYVHGPGGVGKSTLLDMMAARAEQMRVSVVRLDGRALTVSPESVLEALRERLEVPPGDAPISHDGGRIVLFLDSFEYLDPLDEWLRVRLLPRLPRAALAVIASRTAPSAAWRGDLAWRDLLREVPLRNLSPQESREYLRRSGVPELSQDRVIGFAHGHPFSLALLVDVARGGEANMDPVPPDLIGQLLRRFLDGVPDRQQRRALEVCALARVTTETLLRDALQLDDAHDLFAWLRGLSFIESGADGLQPHELARDLLDLDLRWRDPDAYQQIFRRVRAHIHRRLESARGKDQLRAIFDEKFVFRNLPSVLSPVDWSAWGDRYPEPAHDADRAEILDLVTRHEGPESAQLAAHWFDRQRDGFAVVREPDGNVRGVIAHLDLTAASAADRDADPGTTAAWQQANTPEPVRTGEVVTQIRFIVDRTEHQSASPTVNAVPVVSLQRYLSTRALAFDFLTLAEPDQWDAYFALADLPRVDGADFSIGGRRYGLFCHDFRSVPVGELLELWTDRALSQDLSPRPRPQTDVLVLSQPDFVAAVRRALKDLHRPDLLARNPLLRSRLLRDRSGATNPDPGDLAAVLREAVTSLRRDPRDDALLRAVEGTYLRPAGTQEAVASRLGLPFSTYRRHLSHAIARITAWCWDREIHGGSGEQI
jgi:hypothetical protein